MSDRDGHDQRHEGGAVIRDLKVILPAGEVPLGSKVSKRTGEKIYTLRDRLCVYGVDLTL